MPRLLQTGKHSHSARAPAHVNASNNWTIILADHLDQEFVQYIYNSIKHGLRIGFQEDLH